MENLNLLQLCLGSLSKKNALPFVQTEGREGGREGKTAVLGSFYILNKKFWSDF